MKAHIAALDPYQPGKPIEELERELGIAEAIKLAANENPLGPPPKAVAAIQAAAAGLHAGDPPADLPSGGRWSIPASEIPTLPGTGRFVAELGVDALARAIVRHRIRRPRPASRAREGRHPS